MTTNTLLQSQVQDIVVKRGYDFSILNLDYIVSELGDTFVLTEESKSIIANELEKAYVKSHTMKCAALKNMH